MSRDRRAHASGRAGTVASLATALVLLSTACGTGNGLLSAKPTPSTATTEPRRGGSLTVAVPAESNGWNPFINQWTDSGTLVGTSIIEPLAVQDNDGKVEPWLIEAWEPNANFTQWLLTVRPNVVFHDGTPLTAAVVKKNLDVSLHSGFHQVVRSVYDRSEVVEPLKLRVYLHNTWAQYPTSLANEWAMAPSMLDRPDAGVSNPVGTGPFVFLSWDQGRSLRARRWDQYWRRDARGTPLPYLDAVQFRPIPDGAQREQALRNGDVDMALSDAGNISSRLGTGFSVLRDFTGQRTFVMLNTAVGAANKGNPFVNAHARKALAYATDRQRIARLVGDDVQSTTFGFRPDSPWAPTGPDGYVAYDPAQARAEIDRYRADTGARSLSFEVLGLASDESQTTLQALAAMWKEVGIDARITGVDQAKLTLLAAQGAFQAVWFRFHDFPDPDQVNFYYTSANLKPVGEISVNFTHYTSKRLDANLAVLRESVDPVARKAANDDLIRETNDQVIDLWLYDTPESLVASRDVRGLEGFETHAFANNLPKPWLAEAWLAQ